jgi:hypothetical protein
MQAPLDTPPIPLRERRGDLLLMALCASFVLTTFLPDSASVLRVDLVHFERTRAAPPAWPPLFLLEPLRWYGETCDRLFLHNPLYFRAMMWGDVFFTGPFYAAALYAFWRGRNWIRIPAFLYGSHVLSYAVVLTAEQLRGPYASPNPALLFALYVPYWLFGLALMIRLRRHRPFDRRGPA